MGFAYLTHPRDDIIHPSFCVVVEMEYFEIRDVL